MTLEKKVLAVPDHLDVALLAARQGDGSLVLLPDSLSLVEAQTVAGVRDGTQSLRARANEKGVKAALVVPEGARPGGFSEHAADWVLPLVLGIPTMVVADLIADEIRARLAALRGRGLTRMPTFTYREIVVDAKDQTATLRELTGPPEDVADWVLGRAKANEIGRGDENEWQWPARP